MLAVCVGKRRTKPACAVGLRADRCDSDRLPLASGAGVHQPFTTDGRPMEFGRSPALITNRQRQQSRPQGPARSRSFPAGRGLSGSDAIARSYPGSGDGPRLPCSCSMDRCSSQLPRSAPMCHGHCQIAGVVCARPSPCHILRPPAPDSVWRWRLRPFLPCTTSRRRCSVRSRPEWSTDKTSFSRRLSGR
jgi:hypothetical protein